jgi:hypothetical protein
MRILLFISITLISLSSYAQKQHYGVFDKDRFYNCSNKELSLTLNIYELNKKLVVETNFCPECNDTRFHPVTLKKIRQNFHYFEIGDYYFVLDISTMLPALILINAPSNDIKDCQLNPDF